MPNSFEQPDLELMLRGRPTELPSLRVQIVPPHRGRGCWGTIRRHWIALTILPALGAIAGLAIPMLQRPWYEARAAIEPAPAASAEVEAKRLADPELVQSSAAKAELQSLPEYAGYSSPAGTFAQRISSNLRANTSPQGRVVEVAFRSTDPKRAALFLNSLAEEYQDRGIKAQGGGPAGVRERFAGQIAEARVALQRAEDDLVSYIRSAGLTLDPQGGAVIDNRFAQVQKDIANLRSSVPGDSNAANEANRLAAAVRRAQADVAKARAEQAIRYQVKKQDLENKQAIYNDLMKKQQTAIAEATTATASRVLLTAQPPTDPIRPNVLLCGLFGLAGGLLLGGCFAAYREAHDTKLEAPGDIARNLNLRELGAIPHAKQVRQPAAGPRSGKLIDLNPAPRSRKRLGAPEEFAVARGVSGIRDVAGPGDAGESFRSLLASIWIAGQEGKRPRVLVFTSTAEGDGRTTIVTNLGISLANTNRRVLILEADLRHPTLGGVFGKTGEWGLANMLEEETPVEKYGFEKLTLKTDIPGLYLLPAGSGEMNIASMQYVDRLGELLMRFRLEFHAVLIDTPPALEFPDARVVGRLSDGAIFVFRSGATERERAAVLSRRFQDDGIPVLGAVLNDYRQRL